MIDCLQRATQLSDLGACVGGQPPGHVDAELAQLRQHLGAKFSAERSHSEGLWSELLVQLVEKAGDPDKEAATWPRTGTPLGICETIPFGHVFPRMEPDQFVTECERLASLNDLAGAHGNYTTYEENKRDAEELFSLELSKGFVDWSSKREHLEAKYGKLVTSSIGVIVKQKRDGKKVRLVHDLRRSGVNATIKFEERLVLPRLRDVMEDSMILFENLQPGEQVSLLSLDFKDAFKQLPVRHSEKRFLAGEALDGFFVYHVVLFGIRTGPLVWARMAALASRATQSMFRATRCRLQTYVNDPLMLMRGTREQIRDMTNKVLWLWMAMGLQISWSKGSLGNATEWIGAYIHLDNANKVTEVTVTEERLDDWKSLLQSLNRKPLVSSKLLAQFTGKMNWASGFLPQLKPFVRMLHTALALDSKVSDKGSVYHRQVQPALEWFKQFFSGIEGPLVWKVKAHVRHLCCLHVVVDASPWGGGAILYVENRPVETLALQWTADDEARTGARIGDPGSQALWECYMMLRALWCWLKVESQGFVRIVGDAQGVLAALLKRSAKSPLLNLVVREVTLLLARNFRSLETIHVWSEHNEWADALSRIKDPHKPARRPDALLTCRHLEDAPQYWNGCG